MTRTDFYIRIFYNPYMVKMDTNLLHQGAMMNKVRVTSTFRIESDKFYIFRRRD